MTSHTTQLSKRLTNAEDANGKLHARIEQLEGELQVSLIFCSMQQKTNNRSSSRCLKITLV